MKAHEFFAVRAHARRPGVAPRRVILGLVIACATVFILGGPSPAEAQSADCTFLEIKASNQPGGVDKKLAPLAKKLRQPAFASWKSFKQVGRHETKLARGETQEINLELNGKLRADLLEAKSDGIRLAVTVDTKKRKRAVDTKVKVTPGNYLVYVFAATSDSGNLLALTCSTP